jgi:hypothetical protein
MAAAAPRHEAEVRFAAVPAAPLPVASVASARIVRNAAARSDAVLLDSIAAAPTAPWIRRAARPVIPIVHQPPGGMDSGRGSHWLQARLDRMAYRSAVGFIVASESLREALLACGVRRRAASLLTWDQAASLFFEALRDLLRGNGGRPQRVP